MGILYTKSIGDLWKIIKERKTDASDYFTLNVSGTKPRRATYSPIGQPLARIVYARDKHKLNAAAEDTTDINFDAGQIACAYIDNASPTGNDAQYGCPNYTGSAASLSSFTYLHWVNCLPLCENQVAIIDPPEELTWDTNTFPSNLDSLTVHGSSDPDYFWADAKYLVVPITAGMPIFASQADCTDFLNKVSAYFADPDNKEKEKAAKDALDSAINNPNAKEQDEFGKEWAGEDGYGYDGTAGSYDDHSDKIDVPTDPAFSLSKCGLIHVYSIDEEDLDNLGDELFPDPSSASTAEGWLEQLVDLLFRGNLVQYVLDVHIVPCAVPIGVGSNIKIGTKRTSVLGNEIDHDYVTVEAGTISIPEYFKNFADFCSTNCRIFCPFYGYVDVLPEFWNGGTLKLVYKFNLIDGSFMIYIKSTSGHSQLEDTVIAQYAGMACVHTPITGVSYANLVSGLVSGVGGIAINAAAKNAGGVITGAINTVNNIRNAAEMQQSNPYGASSSILSGRQPYLLIEYPAYNVSAGYTKEEGLPLNMYAAIGDMKGFTVVENPILDGIPCTDAERDRIRNLLASGVIIK